MKRNYFKRTILAIATIILPFLSGSNLAYAEDSTITMNITPMWQKIILVPGEKYQSSIKLTSTGTSKEDLEYSVSVGSFSQHGSQGSEDDYSNMDFTTQSDYNQIMEWITIDEDKGSLAANHSTEIPFTINVPKDAPAGGQYASIIIQNDSTKTTDGGVSIKTIPQIASILYAEIAGETIEKGQVLENKLPTFMLNNELSATSRVRNDGNIHTDAEYRLQVWPLFSDEEICTNEEDAESKLIMPETEKYFVQTCVLPAVGIFRAKQSVTLFGQTSETEKVIFVCPLWLIVLIILVIIGLIIWIILRAKSHKK